MANSTLKTPIKMNKSTKKYTKYTNKKKMKCKYFCKCL